MHRVNCIWELSIFYLGASRVYSNCCHVPVNHLSSIAALKLFPRGFTLALVFIICSLFGSQSSPFKHLTQVILTPKIPQSLPIKRGTFDFCPADP